jgi:hypothetical protein
MSLRTEVEPDAPKLCIKPSPVAVVIAITLAAVMVPLMMLCVDSLNLTGNKNVTKVMVTNGCEPTDDLFLTYQI